MRKSFCDICGNEVEPAKKVGRTGFPCTVFTATIGEEKKRVSLDITPAIDGGYDVDVCEACIVNVVINKTVGADKS